MGAETPGKRDPSCKGYIPSQRAATVSLPVPQGVVYSPRIRSAQASALPFPVDIHLRGISYTPD